ncbi:MAG: poly-beta-1,6-N-acetyl-D-glucosamine N-deacetylase PgaB [Nitrospinota bacterium]
MNNMIKMKHISTITFIASLLFFNTAVRSADNPVKAAQILWMGCKNIHEVKSSIVRMKMSGINTLIIRVFQNKYDRVYTFANYPNLFMSAPRNLTGVYFNTSHAPVIADILKEMTVIAHENNMKIFVLMTTRKSDWLIERNPDLRESLYDLKSGDIVKGESLNIFNLQVVEILKDVYRDLARYNIDGIIFQDDLVLRHTEGFSQEARLLFRQDTDFEAEPSLMYKDIFESYGKYYVSSYTPSFWKWSEWKSQRLLLLASELMSAAREVNPDLKFAINLYYETLTSPRNALAWLSQDFNGVAKYKFDYFSVMAYHRQMEKELGLSGDEIYRMLSEMVGTITNKVNDPQKILIKVQLVDWDTKRDISDTEIEKVIHSVKKNGNVSLSLVPVTEDTSLEVIKKVFN